MAPDLLAGSKNYRIFPNPYSNHNTSVFVIVEKPLLKLKMGKTVSVTVARYSRDMGVIPVPVEDFQFWMLMSAAGSF